MLKSDLSTSLPNSDNVVRRELDNGAVVLVYENPSVKSVVINGSLRAGSIYEDPVRGGTASLVAESLMLGTKNRDFDTLSAELEDIGADLEFSTGKFKVGFSGKALAEDLHVLVDVLADSLRNPIFPVEQVERLRGEQLTWMQYRQQDTRWQASRVFRETLYPSHHPFHYSSRGTVDTVAALKVDELRHFHARQYGPDNMIIVVVGAVNADDAIGLVEDCFGDWRNDDQSPIPELPHISTPALSKRIYTSLPGKSQSDIVLGVLGPSRFEADYRAAVIANSILGQFGMMGRIGDVVREREGMAYYAYSSLDGGFGPGSWRVSAGVHPANIERTIELVKHEVKLIISETVDEEDLDDNKSYFIGRLPLQLETSEGVANTLHTIETYDLGLDYLKHYQEEIAALTVDDLLKATQHYLHPERMVVSIAGPESD